MRDPVIFAAILAVALVAIFIGSRRLPAPPSRAAVQERVAIPSIGRIQILNGCGAADAAGRMAEYLRRRGFDVKNNGIGNAPTFNYTQTLVVSRVSDMSIARKVGAALGLGNDRVILARYPQDQGFDVTVFVGADIEEILK